MKHFNWHSFVIKSYHNVIVSFGPSIDLMLGEKVNIVWSALKNAYWSKRGSVCSEEFVKKHMDSWVSMLKKLGEITIC